jgi:hypothetical protein
MDGKKMIFNGLEAHCFHNHLALTTGRRFEAEKSNNIWYLNAIFDQTRQFNPKCSIFLVARLKRNRPIVPTSYS